MTSWRLYLYNWWHLNCLSFSLPPFAVSTQKNRSLWSVIRAIQWLWKSYVNAKCIWPHRNDKIAADRGCPSFQPGNVCPNACRSIFNVFQFSLLCSRYCPYYKISYTNTNIKHTHTHKMYAVWFDVVRRRFTAFNVFFLVRYDLSMVNRDNILWSKKRPTECVSIGYLG